MSSNGEREKRRAKRRERNHRARVASTPPRAEPVARDPGRPKMSQTLVDFAGPLLSQLPPEAETARGWYPELAIAVVTWNGVVAGDAAEVILQRAAELFPFPRSDLPMVIVELMTRKQQLFAEDTRSVLAFDTYERGDRVHVVALSARE